MATATDRPVMPDTEAQYDAFRAANPGPYECCRSAGPVPHFPSFHCLSVNGPGRPLRPHCTCDGCF